MKVKIIILIFLSLLLFKNAHAQNKINPSDFIKYSEQIFDALDKAEAVFLNTDSSEQDARKSILELDIALKKYDRFGKNVWKDKLPQAIRASIVSARIDYDMLLMTKETKYLDKANKEATLARDNFNKYKTINKK
ncbi:MAG TPA: hypothetical protein PLX88_09690 [Syntrophorhabdaceae bacterium]|nr:hypothetical protein [Syntrophorhabdaceae bacterium]MDI9560641.1 hypothetical protein [Pseudomonadota bacterium]HPN98840.1 hypothetical protein [Syntrophorhabdaceae bacterium]